MVSEGSVLIVWTIYFVWISRNSFYFLYFVFALNIVAIICCYYLVESPRYLFGMEKFEECRKIMILIAKRNGVLDY
jgi:predicted ABC-type sugar transport system permease subunit